MHINYCYINVKGLSGKTKRQVKQSNKQNAIMNQIDKRNLQFVRAATISLNQIINICKTDRKDRIICQSSTYCKRHALVHLSRYH